MAKVKHTPKGFGKPATRRRLKKSSRPSLLDELRASRLEIEKEVRKERKEKIKGVSIEDLEQSSFWLYETADDRAVVGTLDEALDLLLANHPEQLDRKALKEEALNNGGIDLDLTGEGEIYHSVEYDPDFEF